MSQKQPTKQQLEQSQQSQQSPQQQQSQQHQQQQSQQHQQQQSQQHQQQQQSSQQRQQQPQQRQRRSRISPEKIAVVVNGWPSQAAHEVAKACAKRGYRVIPFGLATDEIKDQRLDVPDVGSLQLVKYSDPSAKQQLQQHLQQAQQKEMFTIVVDTTNNPTNVNLYNELKVPFIFESKGGEALNQVVRRTEDAKNFSLITERMNKRLAALDSMWEDWSRRFPGLFDEFDFFFKTSRPEETSRSLLGSFSDLINRDFGMDQVQAFREGEEKNLGFTEGMVTREYSFKNGTGTSTFTFRQSVNDEKEYADSVADSVAFLAQKSQEIARPQVFSILDVAQQSRFLTW
jgi:HD-GYP domain-containing protein (c-di-GMP phosphodiesterase class II)